MQNFRQYLLEASTDFAPWHITDPEQVERWIKDMDDGSGKSGCKVNKNGTVTALKENFSPGIAYGDADTPAGRKRVLMIKFKQAKYFEIISPLLYSLWGMPDVCTKGASIFCSSLSSLEHISPKVTGILAISCSKLKEVNSGKVQANTVQFFNTGELNLNKDWKQFASFSTELIVIGDTVVKQLHGKGILNICKLLTATGASKIKVMTTDSPESVQLHNVFQIVNANKDNIIQCQEELFKNNFDQYAKT